MKARAARGAGLGGQGAGGEDAAEEIDAGGGGEGREVHVQVEYSAAEQTRRDGLREAEAVVSPSLPSPPHVQPGAPSLPHHTHPFPFSLTSRRRIQCNRCLEGRAVTGSNGQ